MAKLTKEEFTRIQDGIINAENVVRDVDELIPYAMNSKKHSEYEIKEMEDLIKEFGFTNPILIKPDDTIGAGHKRAMAALNLGLKSVPCKILRSLTDAQWRAYVIADNQSSKKGGWDVENLAHEVEFLKAENFNLDLLGFDDLSALIKDENLKDDDDELEFPKEEHLLIISCLNEEQQRDLFDEFNERSLTCKIM